MSWRNANTTALAKALLTLKTAAEARRFLRDLLTEEEIIEFGKRWQTAQLLWEGVPYSKIVQKTGLSSTTVARVANWLYSGLNGYQLILKRQHHQHTPRLSFARRLR